MGLAFDFVKGEGPRIEQPLRTEADIERLRLFEPREGLGYVLEAIAHDAARARRPGAADRLRRRPVHAGVVRHRRRPLARLRPDQGADVRTPAGLASALRRGWPQVVSGFVVAQVEAGAQAIQIFDSWVGALSAEDYREFARPHTAAVFDALEADRRADDPLRHRHVDDPDRPRGGRRRRDRRRLAPAARRGLGAARLRARRPGQPRSDAAARAAPSHAARRRGRPATAPPAVPATSSTSDTASCPRSPLEHVQALARFVHGYRAA